MKNILFLASIILIFLSGCGRDEEISPEISPVNLYEMKDDASDPVRHKIYEIYKNYGVSVFFNDTVGKYFVQVNIKGDSIFRYECLDPAWSYTGNDGLTYQYAYMTDPDEQSMYLDMLEKFLQKSSKTLYPYAAFVVNNYKTVTKNGTVTLNSNGFVKVFYKLLLVTGDIDTDLKEKSDEIIRRMIENRITDYKDLLPAFNRVSNDYIGKRDWKTLGVDKLTSTVTWKEKVNEFYTETIVVDQFADWPLWGSTTCLNDNWILIDEIPTAELLEQLRRLVRIEIGKFGFIGQSPKGMGPPQNAEEDLRVFVQEVLHYPKAKFKELWGDYPLVMQKYEILSGIIEGKLGIKL